MVNEPLFLRILFLSLIVTAFGFLKPGTSNQNIVEMTPNDPVVAEFGTIVLNCTLTSNYRGPCNASDFSVDHSILEFYYPYIRAITNETAQFRLPNATVENNGRFSCSLPSNCYVESLGQLFAQYVHVARDPLKPFLINCTVDNWEFLVCSWGPNKSFQGIHMNSPKSLKQIFLWQHPGDGNNWTSCPERVSEQCFWRSSNFSMKMYCIKIIVWNAVSSNISSEVECRHPERLVKPKPPTNIRKMTTAAEDSGTLSIQWDAPTVKTVPIIYHMTVHSRWEVRNFTIINDTSVSISVVPFTDYHVSLVAFPSELGFPSDEALASFSTSSTVPSENPLVMTNFYSVNTAERIVFLYWQPISERNYCGPGFCYYVHNRTSSRSSNPSMCINSIYSVAFNWIGFTSDLLIVSRNDIGPALQPSSAIRVASNADLFCDYEVIAEGEGKDVSIEWFLENSSADRKIESVMLFWCQSQSISPGNCKTSIQWQTIHGSQHNFNLTVDEGFRIFQFGVSVKFSNSNFSGIKWAKKKCSSTKIPDAPNGLHVSRLPGKHQELEIGWMEPRYSYEGPCIRSFTIFYCSVDDQDQCRYDNQSVTVFKYLNHLIISGDDGSFVLDGLDPYSKYKIWMISNTRLRSSKSSEFAYGITTQPWFSPGKIIGIVIGFLLAASVVIFGLYVTFRRCDKYRQKFSSGLKVSLPHKRFQLQSTSSEVPMLGDHNSSEYWRQPSQMSAGSRDSGHYSFPPSSPVMLPLLSEDIGGPKGGQTNTRTTKNCYQPTYFNGMETNADDGTTVACNTLGIASYKIESNPQYVRIRFDQIQYIIPEQVGNGAMPTNVINCSAGETKNDDVDYYYNAKDSSDIGYTKIEQLPLTVSNQCSEAASKRNSDDRKNEDSNLLVCFDRRSGEFGSANLHSAPVVGHLDKLLDGSEEAEPLTDGFHANTEPLVVSDSYPASARKLVEEDLPLHSQQALRSVELKVPESNKCSEDNSSDSCYLPHNRLFGID